MFEDTLLIIKADYIYKRKPVLLYLIHNGFMIQAQRKLVFTPEDAAEFYKSRTEELDFMLQVIMLAKGVSEAFILTKENAVQELISTMVCYFITSTEMDQMVHVTRSVEYVQSEISFIFPNYIHEPIPSAMPGKICADSLLPSLITKIYEIVKDFPCNEQRNWKNKLADWLALIDPNLPIITDQCSTSQNLSSAEKGLQVNLHNVKGAAKNIEECDAATSLLSTDSIDLAMMSSSSCVTCSNFDHTDVCSDTMREKSSTTDIVYPKVKPLPKLEEDQSQASDSELCHKHCDSSKGSSAMQESGSEMERVYAGDHETTGAHEDYLDGLFMNPMQADLEKLYHDNEAVNATQEELEKLYLESEALTAAREEAMEEMYSDSDAYLNYQEKFHGDE